MPIFDQLSQEADARGLKFLVIGGHAVAAHGYARQTVDLDILAPKTERERWTATLTGMGYGIFHEQEAFSQFAPGDTRTRALDVMWVNESSFAGLMAEAVEKDFDGVRLRVPSLEHLLALKLHAAKHGAAHRKFKDLLDVVYLTEANRIDIQSEMFKKLCHKYGDEQVYASILVIAQGH